MGTDFLELLEARDISVGGVGIQVDHSLQDCDLNSEVKLVIELPDRRPFLASGYLVHKTADRQFTVFGIRFSHLPQDAVECLEEYVQRMVDLGRTC
jgi:hypothetical protein